MSRYENPPLVGVGVAFFFEPSPNKTEWDHSLVDEMVDAMEAQYPKLDARYTDKIRVENPHTEGTLPKIVEHEQKLELVKMISEDERQIVYLGDDLISFNLLSESSDYLGFQPLLDGGLNYLDQYRKVFHPQRVREAAIHHRCLLYTSPSPRDATLSRMPSSA